MLPNLLSWKVQSFLSGRDAEGKAGRRRAKHPEAQMIEALTLVEKPIAALGQDYNWKTGKEFPSSLRPRETRTSE